MKHIFSTQLLTRDKTIGRPDLKHIKTFEITLLRKKITQIQNIYYTLNTSLELSMFFICTEPKIALDTFLDLTCSSTS